MLDALEDMQVLEQTEMQLIGNSDETTWLEILRNTAYLIMDMVDELQDTTAPAAATMTRMLPRLAIRRNSMAAKVNKIKKEVMRLERYYPNGFDEYPATTKEQQRSMDERVTVPCFEEALLAIGRAPDKQRIVAVLLSAASNITQGHPSCTILPIFGFPGSGKTNLAQMVFNDDTHSLQGYNFRVWVHVSLEFDFHRIGESILRQVVSGGGEKEEINNHDSNLDVVGMECIMKRLHKLLNAKKMFLVLDDLWEEDPIQLQLLKSMLTFLGDKVDVIVTTCNQAIARKICTVLQPYRLNPLGDDTCWEIIKKLVGFEEDEELEKIGRKIASNCRGVPLAAVERANLLVASRDPTRWEKVMEIGVPYQKDFKPRSLFQSFLLSYMSMPPELRLCFDYGCAIFLNGHSIVKDDLVHQWIALDLIEPSERLSATEITKGYLTRLLDMSFFQAAKSDVTSGNDNNCPTMFTIHDVALAYGASFFSKMWGIPCLQYQLVTNSHGKLDDQYDGNLRALRFIGCRDVEFNNDWFSSKRCLRVLELKESPVQKLPDSICRLRYLRYLKITEFYGLATLPESFGDLTSLFHVNLSGCSGLINIPESFGKLIRLVHLNLSGCSGLINLPESFKYLINLCHVNLSRCHGLVEFPEPLQKLDKLVHLDLSFWSCFEGIGKGLRSLTNLEHLNLSSPCYYLAQQRSHLQELKDVLCKLTSLRYLNLTMCLNPIFYYMSEKDSIQYIKSCVSGLSSLEHLDLSHNTFLFDLSESISNLNRLHILDLSGCIRLKKVGAMKSLKFISLKNCRALESCNFFVCVDEDAAAYSSSSLVQLEDVDCKELQISCLEKVRSIEEAQRINLVVKEKLEKLKLSWTLDSVRSVEDSALLGELTPPPNLQYLEINSYDSTRLPEYLGDLTSLQELKVICCKQLNSLPDNIRKLTSLKDLCIFGCPELEKWCQQEDSKKMLAHIPNRNYGEHGSTSRPEIEEDGRSVNGVEVA